MKKRPISRSLEDYIEAIFIITSKHDNVARAKEIADQLDVSRASVTGALKTLSSRGIINYTPYSYITLTPTGKKLGKKLLKRHKTLKNFFVKILGINNKKAELAACGIEHSVDEEILDKFHDLLEHIEKNPQFIPSSLKKAKTDSSL